MRRLTLREVNEQYGGALPCDATLRPDEEPASPSPSSPSSAGGPQKKRKGARSQRFLTLNAFADVGLAALSGSETKVWLILFRDTKEAGTARTGQADVARRAGLSLRGVQKAIDALQTKGMLRVVRRGRLNAGPSTYVVHPTGNA